MTSETGATGTTTRPEFSEPGHRARLLSNNSYNLVQELGEVLQGAWRIDQ